MSDFELEVAGLTDAGTARGENEDCCGTFREAEDRAVAAVADGVSSLPGGEVASQMAVEVLLRAYREEAPAAAGQRLYRAFQQANIEIYDRSVAVPELRGMATTLTAAVVERGDLTAVHVGDSRLYLVRRDAVTQLTKDHTVAAGRQRLGILDKEQLRHHAGRSVLTRSMGRELIVTRDRITQRLAQDDVLLLCSDGLHGVLEDAELAALVRGRDATAACRALLEAANARGTPDNLSAAVIRVAGRVPGGEPPGIAGRLRRILGGRP